MKQLRVRKLMSIIAILALPIMAVRLIHQGNEAARDGDCRSQLRQYGLALFNYESVYGCLPPEFVADRTGRPVHSWRVAYLPIWVDHDLSGKYDFSVPWDHPRNAWLASYNTHAFFFWCPSGDGHR